MTFMKSNSKAGFAGVALFFLLGGCAMQQRFDDPNQAVQCLVASMRAGNETQVQQILGKEGEDLLDSGDPVADKANVDRFLSAYDQKHQLTPLDDKTVRLDVGTDDWPMPIPIVEDTLWRKWYFDTGAGKEEILNRRIGRNELDTIQTCLAIVDAQREYAQRNPENSPLPVYAGKFFSDPGHKNGLYWDTTDQEQPSPLGPFAARADSEGYELPAANDTGPNPYHGYLFRMLKSQGTYASGGARDYVVNGYFLGGFAVIAYPANYGTSGIMTFIISQDGILYQRDLGPDTARTASQITSYDPDPRWTRVQQSAEDDSDISN